MATYAIGDVQGCFDELTTLVKKIAFNPESDHLWFVGDLVNRGPQSLEALRWIKSLGDAATTVLGNHDLHLLAAYAGIKPVNETDDLYPILQADDAEDLIDWLRHRPLMHYDPELDIAMIHAGLFPQWDIKKALSLAKEAEAALRSKKYKDFLQNMYGNKPDCWEETLDGWERLRTIINCLTRMRYCSDEGVMSFNDKGPSGTQSAGMRPWFEINSRKSRNTTIVFGHWSTLGLHTGHNVIATDTGCLWGGSLTAVKIDDSEKTVFQIECEAKLPVPDMS